MTPRSDQTLAALFQDGEVRLVDESDGWEGFRRETDADGEPAYFYLDTRPHVPEPRQEIRVGERAVRETLRERLKTDAELAVADGGTER